MNETYTVDSGDKLTQVSVSGVATKTFGYDGAGRTGMRVKAKVKIE